MLGKVSPRTAAKTKKGREKISLDSNSPIQGFWVAYRRVIRPATQKRQGSEIIMPRSAAPQDARPIRAETRATLIASIARGRRWLDEIVAGSVTAEQIAAREHCGVRHAVPPMTATSAARMIRSAVTTACAL